MMSFTVLLSSYLYVAFDSLRRQTKAFHIFFIAAPSCSTAGDTWRIRLVEMSQRKPLGKRDFTINLVKLN